eukprot:8824806-Pyramimonas_sp.AAC.1
MRSSTYIVIGNTHSAGMMKDPMLRRSEVDAENVFALVERPIKGLPVVMIGVIGGRVADLLENRTNNVALPVFNTPTTC